MDNQVVEPGNGAGPSIAAIFSALRDFDNSAGGPDCCAARPVSTERARLCAGAMGVVGRLLMWTGNILRRPGLQSFF